MALVRKYSSNVFVVDHELAELWVSKSEEHGVNYYYGGTRTVDYRYTDEEVYAVINYLKDFESGLKNTLINKAIEDGALNRLSKTVPVGFLGSKVGGGRCVIKPKSAEVAEIITDVKHPEHPTVVESLFLSLGNFLNEMHGEIKLTPDFGRFSGLADHLNKFTDHVLGIACDNGGCGGKASYTSTGIIQAIKSLGFESKKNTSVYTGTHRLDTLKKGVQSMGTFSVYWSKQWRDFMSKKLFGDEDREHLSRNRCVTRISDRAITYSDEFKQLFIDQYMMGRSPREIFEANGFDLHVIGMKRVEQCAARWKKAYDHAGIIGLADSRKENSGRPLTRELTQDEIIAKQEAKIRILESQVELLKKLDSKERMLVEKGKNISKNKLFELIKEAVDQGLERMTRYLCELLNVSRSGYYSYLQAAETRLVHSRLDAKAGEWIRKAFNRKGFKKGSRSIKMILENEFGLTYNLKRIRRLMKKLNLVCPHRKPNPYKRMAKATLEHRTLPNKLQRDFKKGVPGLALLTDITYLPYGRTNMAYLSTVLDASTGEILSYNLSNRIELSLATETIETLVKQKRLKLHKDAFIHSDQGSHYTSPKYQELLKQKGLGQSMSRRGNCWDNAPQESFFGHMKDHVKSRSCSSFRELQHEINRYINYYNYYRYQWGLKKMTPVQYRNHLLSAV